MAVALACAFALPAAAQDAAPAEGASPAAAPVAAETPAAAEGKGKIYFFRPSRLPGAVYTYHIVEVGDDVRLFTDEHRNQELATFFTLRQQLTKREGKASMALADYVAPLDSGKPDYLGAFVVTAGGEEDEIARRYAKELDQVQQGLFGEA